ncbi:DUF2207 domain-containing protein [Okibacterium endophyticum]
MITVSSRFILRFAPLTAVVLGIAFAAALVGGLWSSPAEASERADTVTAAAVPAGVDDFRFSSFEGEYTLGRDDEGHSTLRSVETFVAEFPEFDQNRGIIRAIPEGSDGVHWKTQIESVTDASGNDIPYDDSETEDGFILLSLGTDEYVHGTQTYVVTYTQRDVVRSFDDTDAAEFYWNAPGTGWAQPFDGAQMSVVVPNELSDSLTGQNTCYLGSQGSDRQCEISESDSGDAHVLRSPDTVLAAHETFTMAIAFEPGTFTEPEIPSTWPIFTWVPLVVVAGLVATLVTGMVLRHRHTRDARGRGIVVAQYAAPKDLDLFVAGDLIGRVNLAMPASLISLAVRRHLRIIDGSATGSDGYRLQLLNPDGLSAGDRQVVDELFGAGAAPGTLRDITAKDTALTKVVVEWFTQAPARSVAAGYRVTRRVPKAWITVAIAIALVLCAVGLLVASAVLYGTNAFTIGGMIAGIVLAIGTFIAVSPRKALTPAGAETREHLLGLRDYLRLAEKDRIEMLQSPTGAERVNVGDDLEMVTFYEKLLPYAVLWGVEKEWAQELGDYYDRSHSSPDWYHSDRGFSSVVFASSLAGLSASGGSTPWSGSAVSSASGGSGGGGFAGGGGGGGGGGGR